MSDGRGDRTDGRQQDADWQRKRKQQVLTHPSASAVRSISDAVVIKDGEPFFLCPPDGQMPLDGRHGFGLYLHDMRFLDGYQFRVAGEKPVPLVATAAEGDRAILEMTNPQITGSHRLPRDRLDVHWVRTINGDKRCLRDEVTIRNLGESRLEFPVSFELTCDFRDIFAIRGLLEAQPGTLEAPSWDGPTVKFGYDGQDGVRRELHATFEPAPARATDTRAVYDVGIDGWGETRIQVELDLHETIRKGAQPIERRATTAEPSRGNAEPAEEGWVGGGRWALARTESLTLRETLGRALEDLSLLRSTLDGRAYYEAGTPWFATLFGRDSLIAGLQTLAFDPSTAAGTLRLLASRQGTHDDDWRDEEPGKILHELRIGEFARLGEIPHTPYYGTIDATPLFLVVLARHAAWTGSLDLFHELRDNVDRALDWIARNEERHDGYLAYLSATERGLVNQGWKDSGDAIVGADGRQAVPPISLVEVQGYVYRARREIAALLERDGDDARARALRADAEDLRRRFEDDFWSDELGCYVLALGRDQEPCEVVTSNAGQVLWTGIAAPDRAARVADRLLAPDAFSGWGIRTLAASARAYSAIGYHLGTVWPHDNGLIAAGFRVYGHDDAAETIFAGLLEAATDFPNRRLPECFAGFGKHDYGSPVRYPVACHPQAWAAGSIPHLLTWTLGLAADAFDGVLRIESPRLPAFIGSVELKDVRVGGGRAHVRFERGDDGRTQVEVLDGTKDVEVQVEDGSRQSADERREAARQASADRPAGPAATGARPAMSGAASERRVR